MDQVQCGKRIADIDHEVIEHEGARHHQAGEEGIIGIRRGKAGYRLGQLYAIDKQLEVKMPARFALVIRMHGDAMVGAIGDLHPGQGGPAIGTGMTHRIRCVPNPQKTIRGHVHLQLCKVSVFGRTGVSPAGHFTYAVDPQAGVRTRAGESIGHQAIDRQYLRVLRIRNREIALNRQGIVGTDHPRRGVTTRAIPPTESRQFGTRQEIFKRLGVAYNIRGIGCLNGNGARLEKAVSPVLYVQRQFIYACCGK